MNKIKIPIMLVMLLLIGNTSFGQQTLEIKPYAGYNISLGKFSNFSKNGAVAGISADYFFTPNFGLGIDVNSQFNAFKNPTNFSRIPALHDTDYNDTFPARPVNIIESQNGSWNTLTFSFGPTYRMNYKKFGTDLYTKVGISILNTPEASVIHEYDFTETDLFRLNKQNSIALGLTSGIRFYYHVNEKLSIYANPQFVYNATKVDYTIVNDLDPAFNTGSLTEDPITGFDNEAVRNVVAQEESFNPALFNLNAGVSFNIGTKEKPKGITDSFGPTYRMNYKKYSSIKESNNSESEEIFTSTEMKKVEEPKQEECLAISQPRNGNSYSTEEDVRIALKNPGESKNTSLTLYKISDDPEYWNKAENYDQLMDGDDPSSLCATFEKEAKETKFEPLSLKSKPKGKTIEAVLEKNTLKEGSYKLIASNDCGITSSNFILKSGGCGNISATLDISCDGFENGKPKYTVSLFLTNSSSPAKACDATYSLINSATGTLSNISSLPSTVQPGNNPSITFTYLPNNASTTYAAFYFKGNWTDGEQNSVNFRDTINQLPSCICDFCDDKMKPSEEQNRATTYDMNGNSLTIHQGLWSNGDQGETVVGAKAEIISFEREVSDECMRCDKDSRQWGNFISGNLGQTNGSFGNANNGVDGNTHHTLYFNDPDQEASTFDLNIGIPPLSTLDCCCEKITILVRYTYTFKDEKGACKMCSKVFKYTYQKGACDAKPVNPKPPIFGGGNYEFEELAPYVIGVKVPAGKGTSSATLNSKKK